MKFKLKVELSKNPTKQGIKVQFVLPQVNLEPTQREDITQQLQAKLDKALQPLGININVDTDIQFSNVVGFLILLSDLRLMLKKALSKKDTITPDSLTSLNSPLDGKEEESQ